MRGFGSDALTPDAKPIVAAFGRNAASRLARGSGAALARAPDGSDFRISVF